MIRLFTIALVATAIGTQVASEPQGPATWTCSCNNGNQSPWPNQFPPNYRGQYQSLVANGPPVAGPAANAPYVPCSCKDYSGPLPLAPGYPAPPGLPASGPLGPPGLPIAPGSPFPPGLPNDPGPFVVPGPPGPAPPPGPIALPGPPAPPCHNGPAPPGYSQNSLVVFSQGPLPQNTPTFVQSSGSLNFPGAPVGLHASPVDKTSSHIMSIPKKDTPVSFKFTNSSPIPENFVPSNSIYSSPPPSPAPSPLYYTQPASLVSSCPATVIYPATQPQQFTPPQNAVLPYPPPNTFVPPPPPQSSGPNYSQPISIPTTLVPPAPSSSASFPKPTAPAGPSPPRVVPSGPAGPQSKSPLTYTLLGANKSSLPGSSLEAENNDCAMPVPPPLLKTN